MAFSTIEAVEKWFFDNTDEGKPAAWRIFSGAYNKNHDSGSAKAETAEEAWTLLKSHLDNMVFDPGEYLTIRIYKNPNAQYGGGGTDMIYRPIPKNSYGGGGQSAGISGINTQSYIAEQIDQRMTIYDLRRQVEDLKAEMDGKQSIVERVVSTITEHPNFDPNALINGIGSLIMSLIPRRAQVGVTGFSSQASAADPDTEEESARIAAALERLAAHFPEIQLSKLLEDLANFVDKNPEMAKQLLKNL